jgi:hypothetical protein
VLDITAERAGADMPRIGHRLTVRGEIGTVAERGTFDGAIAAASERRIKRHFRPEVNDGVLSAVAIVRAAWIGGVSNPTSAIHDELVAARSGGNINDYRKATVGGALHGYRLPLPASEISSHGC